jgi:hypothetical protein
MIQAMTMDYYCVVIFLFLDFLMYLRQLPIDCILNNNIVVLVPDFLRTNYTFFFFESIPTSPPKSTKTPRIAVNTDAYS